MNLKVGDKVKLYKYPTFVKYRIDTLQPGEYTVIEIADDPIKSDTLITVELDNGESKQIQVFPISIKR